MVKKTIKIKATLKLIGRYYEAEGKTLQETIFNLKPPVAKTIGVLTLKKGELERLKILQPRVIMGLWGKQSKTMQDVAMKHINLLFSDFDG